VRTAVVSGSRNADEVLATAHLDGLFEVLVDGVEAGRMGLGAKPGPAKLLETAHRLGLPADRVVVVEADVSGVEAARDGGFGLVIAVDRGGEAQRLREAGADVVVADLADVLVKSSATCCPSLPRGTSKPGSTD
jgi:alpha,alpha-trehalase